MLARFVFALVGAMLLAAAATRVAAQGAGADPFPPGTITIVVPLAAGGPVDVLARLMADRLAPRLGHAMIVENKAGAAGNLGSAAVARSAPNGLTWLLTIDSVLTVNPHVYAGKSAGQGFDPDKDLVPVGQIGQVVLMLAVNPKVPVKTWSELLAYNKAHPLTFGSAGIGSPGHLALEYLKTLSPLDAAHVPFRGASLALTELIAGNVDAAFIVAGVMLDHVQAGALRALAVSDSRRLPAFPDVPTAAEAGIPDFEARFTNILALPARTPEPVLRSIAAEVTRFAALDDVKAKLAAIGTESLVTGPDETKAWVARERARWGKVIAAAGLGTK